MSGGYIAPSGDELAALADALQALAVRLSELEQPTGTSLNSLVDQVQQAIADIDTTVTASITANSYTKSQIDSKIASPGAIAPSTVAVGGALTCLDAYGFDITYTRRTAWWGNDGRAGYASSSREKKTAIRPALIDVESFLSIEPKWFEYKAQHAWKQIAAELPEDDPRYNPDYRVPTELGLIAEELVEAGHGDSVFFAENGSPEGIEYSMLVVPLLATARHLYAENVALKADHADLAARVSALESSRENP